MNDGLGDRFIMTNLVESVLSARLPYDDARTRGTKHHASRPSQIAGQRIGHDLRHGRVFLGDLFTALNIGERTRCIWVCTDGRRCVESFALRYEYSQNDAPDALLSRTHLIL